MTIRQTPLVRVGFRRIGASSSGGLPYASPLIPNAVVTINGAGTAATTSAALLFNPSGEGSLAVLFDGTAYTPVTDRAALLVKKLSGVPSAIFDGGLSSGVEIQLRNGGGGTSDKITSSNLNGFQIGGNAGGFTNSGLTLNPGNPGFATIDISTDQLFVLGASGKVGFFGATPVPARPKTTNGPAGGAYNATAQAMLNDCFNTLRGLGVLI